MNAFLLSLRGTACTYQGEELGLTEVEVPREAIKDPYGIAFWPTFKGRDGCRTPMPWNATNQAGFSDGQPWLPIPDTHRGASVSLQEADRGSVLNAYRAMIRFRQSHAALRWGSMQLLPATDELLVFAREYEGQTVIAAFNFGASSTRMSLPVGTKIEALTGHGFDPCDIGPGVVELPPAGVFFGLLRSNKN